ncbi:MAG: hypothetical protein FJ090_08635 [Deltaproteobacteria bacterium]|nr:hypothetical protein [Deltaproteobacteria bacterium]
MLILAAAALAVPFFAERFDANAIPADWKVRAIESTGGGEASKVTVENGQLVVATGKSGNKFSGLARKFELRGVSWLKVQARVQSDVAGGGGPCDVVLRFDGGVVEPARPCLPRDDAAPYTRFVQVPPGARDVEFAMYNTQPGTVRFDDILLEAVNVEWKTVNRRVVSYYWQGNDAFRDESLVANDELVDKTLALIGLAQKVHLEVWKYPDAATLEHYTGVHADGYVDGDTLHTTVRTDAKNMVQMLARAWGGAPAPALADGLPVHVLGQWDDREPRMVTRRLVGEGKCPSLAELLDPARYATLGAERVLVAGALVSWLVEVKGAEAVKAAYGASNAASALESALGMSLGEAEAKFRAWL